MKVKDIIETIEKFAPFSLAYSWDNVGLLVGDAEREVKRALLTLDTDVRIVEEAIEKGCNVIVSHHPIFFSAIKQIKTGSAEGKMIELLLKNDISVIAAHTNMDCAEFGINYGLAKLFELENIEVMEEDEKHPGCGLGRVGNLKKPMTLRELAEMTKKVLNVPALRYAGDDETVIERLAVSGGSCSEDIPFAREKGCTAIVTADMKYHEMINNAIDGMCVIDPGHYGTEHHVIGIFEEVLAPLGIETVASENKDIFKFI
jgi:dinuclear metal center YbgI/SA1388 family protein